MINFIPSRKKLLIEPTDPIKTTKGGILLADNATEEPTTGIIRAVNPEEDRYKVGQLVYFAKHYTSSTVELEGKKYHVMHRRDIVGHWTEEGTETEEEVETQ